MNGSPELVDQIVPSIAFYILAALAVVSALGVVLSGKIIHSAFSLAACFLAVAGLYILLQAEFLFAVQILIYVGAVMVLVVFAIMMTRDDQSSNKKSFNHQWSIGALAALLILGLTIWLIGSTDWQIAQEIVIFDDNTKALGETLFRQYVLPFEILSIVLLAAIFGAIVVSRKD